MLKHLKLAAVALLIAMGIAGCSDDPAQPNLPETGYTGQVAYVVNQGNQGNKLPGSIDRLNLNDRTVTSGIFYQANSQYLGDTPQAPVRYKNYVLVPMFGSDCVWVIDATTMLKVAQLNVKAPEAVVGADGYIFVASNNGYVERFDATTFALAGNQLEVGPNPAGLAAGNGKVYVTISDGYNYQNNYVNGKKVVAIDSKEFKATATYDVGLNPGQIFTNSKGYVYFVARGNYADVQSTVQQIAPDGTVSDVMAGSNITLCNDTLYVLSITYDANWQPKAAGYWYDTVSGAKGGDFLDAANLPVNPIAIDVNPVNSHIFICSRQSTSGDAYSNPGVVYEYNSLKEGAKWAYTYNVGVEPYGVAFN